MNADKLFDAIGDAKGAYVMETQQYREGKSEKARFSVKKAVSITIAATLILATMTGAAVLIRWAKSTEAAYSPSPEQKEMAQDLGLSAMLEKEQKAAPISASDQGITITAVQTVVDPYRAHITYRIEGFDLAEGECPFAMGGITKIDGHSIIDFPHGSSGYFYDGTMTNSDGDRVYEDGTPVQHDESGTTILRFKAEDGSLEYIERIYFREPGKHLGKEVEAQFTSIGHSAGPAEYAADVEGNWTMNWTLTGTDKTYTAAPNAPIGDTGHTLLECEVTPLTIRAKLKTASYYNGWDRLEQFPNRIVGVRMKDGSINTNTMGAGSEGYEDAKNLIAVLEVETMDILDVDQVESILFFKDCTFDENGRILEMTYHEVPIR